MKITLNLIMDTLVKDVVLEIFKFLFVCEILIMGRINKHFLKITRNNVLPQTFSTGKILLMQHILAKHDFESYDFIRTIGDDDLQILRNKMGSNNIKFTICPYINNGSNTLKRFNNISFVNCHNLSNKLFENLSGCKSLKFSYCNITDEGLSLVKNCHKLKILHCDNIKGYGLTKLNCHYLDISYFSYPIDEHLKNLNCNKLNLAGCKELTDVGLKNLKYFDYIDISMCDKITDQGIEYLNCRKLKMGGCNKLTYTNTKNLKCIKLNVASYLNYNHNNETFKTFAVFKSLNLSGWSITDKDLFYVKDCEKIKLVNCVKITETGILSLNCKKITICKCMKIIKIREIEKKLRCVINYVKSCAILN